jgi:hypothetical protein
LKFIQIIFKNSAPRKDGRDELLDGQMKVVGKEYGKGGKAEKRYENDEWHER